MERINATLETEIVQKAISISSQSPSPVKCWRCLGVGVELVANGKPIREQKITPLTTLAARNCLCVRRKQARANLALIPPVFGGPRLSRLRPRADLHPSQVAAINLVRAQPDDSYLFVGKNGTGKTHIAWAIYRHALATRRPVVACALRDLLAEFRRVEVGVPDGETVKTPRITAETLRKGGKPWLVFLDEFEKARPSEFASEQLFNLLDAARSFNHQIVVTSNLSAEGLRHHWSRIDEIWGNSIMTRLQMCNQVEFF